MQSAEITSLTAKDFCEWLDQQPYSRPFFYGPDICKSCIIAEYLRDLGAPDPSVGLTLATIDEASDAPHTVLPPWAQAVASTCAMPDDPNWHSRIIANALIA